MSFAKNNKQLKKYFGKKQEAKDQYIIDGCS